MTDQLLDTKAAAKALGVPADLISKWKHRHVDGATPAGYIPGRSRTGLVPLWKLEDLQPLADAYHQRNAERMHTVNLPEFLLAEIAADETLARAAIERNGAEWTATDLRHSGWRIAGTTDVGNPHVYPGEPQLWDDEGAMGMFEETALHIVRHDPAHVLAECAAKRQIVELHAVDCYPSSGPEGDDEFFCEGCRVELVYRADEVRCPTLLALAAAYADRPGYREEWRPDSPTDRESTE